MSETSQSSEKILACRYIRGQLDKLVQHLEGARDPEDIENVHQVRVACRRMGAAMCLFEDCLGRKQVKGWAKRLKTLHRSFGRARDLDVQMAFLTEQIKGLSPNQAALGPGLSRMLLRRTQQREAVQPNIVEAVDRIRKKSTLMDMHLAVEKTMFHWNPRQPLIQDPEIYQRAYQSIHDYIGRLRDLRALMNDPNDTQGHHKIRIAAKKLRYVMEIFNDALEGALKPAIKTIKELQTLLGDIHDCDVWDGEIEHFIKAEAQRTIDFFGDAEAFDAMLPGMDYLKSEQRTRRLELYRQSCVLFEQMEKNEFWQKLLMWLQKRSLQTETAQKGSPHDRTVPPSEA